ncbi:MAG: AAA family ATPase [Alphaproteobacteria bacterium]|nr:AAA family ATPase [Alphaproteobacteria bacterium]
MSLGRSISILLQGPAKAGKSTFASTSPKPMCYLDCEGGTRFLPITAVVWDPRTAPPEFDGTWDTAVVKIRNYDDATLAYQWLQSGKHPFTSLVVDSISELQQKLVDKISGRNQMQTQDWGEVFRNFMGMLRDFRDLCENPIRPLTSVVLVAMSKTVDKGLKIPQLQGQSLTYLPYLFDVTAAAHVYTWRDEQQNQMTSFRLLVGPNDMYQVGERVGGRIPAELENPTVPMILDYVFGPETPAESTEPQASA